MIKMSSLRIVLLSFAVCSATARAQHITPEMAQKLHEQVAGSLVGVQFTWEYEYGKAEFVEPGVVVSADGLIMIPSAEVLPRVPDTQLKDFKVIVPQENKDELELEALLVGRDERSNVTFVRAKEKRDWKPIKFEDVPVQIGEELLSVGILPKDAGYGSYYTQAVVSRQMRGEVPMVLAMGGGLAGVGAPVFNVKGQAVGWVNYYPTQQFLLHTTMTSRRGGDVDMMAPINLPPKLFVPTHAFLQSLNDPPKAEPLPLPWIGVPHMTGLNKDVAELYGLENQPAVEIGDVVAGSPADKAGLKVGMKIAKLNGQPLERGDVPEELPAILERRILCMPIGSKITLGVITEKDKPMKDFSITLEERPMQATVAKRMWAEDLGFGARNLVWEDTYERKQPADLKGVVVSVVKPSGAAANAKLGREDIITQFNNAPVTDVQQFEKDYKTFREQKPKEAIVLVVMKQDTTTQTVRIEPPQ